MRLNYETVENCFINRLVGLNSPGINSIQGEHTGKTAELYYLKHIDSAFLS